MASLEKPDLVTTNVRWRLALGSPEGPKVRGDCRRDRIGFPVLHLR
jgi:hypothetical protein